MYDVTDDDIDDVESSQQPGLSHATTLEKQLPILELLKVIIYFIFFEFYGLKCKFC